MILIDYSNVAISAIMGMAIDSRVKLDPMVCKHAILNSLRARNVQFRQDFGQMVIVLDDKDYWRTDIFPHYKASRKLKKKNDAHDWDMINEAMNDTVEAIADFFPFPIVGVPRCEADDVIGWWAKNADEPSVIVAGDKDYHQCHSQMVCQWKNTKKLLLRLPNPTLELKELLIRGDTDDGVPNMRSVDDVFVNPDLRQKPIKEVDFAVWMADHQDSFLITEHIKERKSTRTIDGKKVKVVLPEEYVYRKENYERNQRLIDFDFIPDQYKAEIMSAMEQSKYKVKGNRKRMVEWLMKNRMRYLMQNFNDFFIGV